MKCKKKFLKDAIIWPFINKANALNIVGFWDKLQKLKCERSVETLYNFYLTL